MHSFRVFKIIAQTIVELVKNVILMLNHCGSVVGGIELICPRFYWCIYLDQKILNVYFRDAAVYMSKISSFVFITLSCNIFNPFSLLDLIQSFKWFLCDHTHSFFLNTMQMMWKSFFFIFLCNSSLSFSFSWLLVTVTCHCLVTISHVRLSGKHQQAISKRTNYHKPIPIMSSIIFHVYTSSNDS